LLVKICITLGPRSTRIGSNLTQSNIGFKKATGQEGISNKNSSRLGKISNNIAGSKRTDTRIGLRNNSDQ